MFAAMGNLLSRRLYFLFARFWAHLVPVPDGILTGCHFLIDLLRHVTGVGWGRRQGGLVLAQFVPTISGRGFLSHSISRVKYIGVCRR